MMRLQTNENRCPLMQAFFPFWEEKALCVFPPPDEGGKKMDDAATDGTVGEYSCSSKRRPYQSASETPLWASLTAVRSAMGKRYPWKKELEKFMRYRSVFIGGAMLSMITLGCMVI